MKNKGLIIAIICLCVTIIVSVIILSVVITMNTSSTNKLAEKQLKEEEQKEATLTDEEAFEKLYGMSASEAKEYIREQLQLTYDNRDLMNNYGSDLIDNELIKLNKVKDITIWRNVKPSDGENVNIYASLYYLDDEEAIQNNLKIYSHKQEDGHWDFVVCHTVDLFGKCIIFEHDKDGWYADRIETVIGGKIQ